MNPILVDMDALAKKTMGQNTMSSMLEIANTVKTLIEAIVEETRIPDLDSQVQIHTRTDDNMESVRVTLRMSHSK